MLQIKKQLKGRYGLTFGLNYAPISVPLRECEFCVCRMLLAMKTLQLWPKMKSSIAFGKLKEK